MDERTGWWPGTLVRRLLRAVGANDNKAEPRVDDDAAKVIEALDRLAKDRDVKTVDELAKLLEQSDPNA